jgi:hypothetical protein
MCVAIECLLSLCLYLYASGQCCGLGSGMTQTTEIWVYEINVFSSPFSKSPMLAWTLIY